jgi:hypothetical protein
MGKGKFRLGVFESRYGLRRLSANMSAVRHQHLTGALPY